MDEVIKNEELEAKVDEIEIQNRVQAQEAQEAQVSENGLESTQVVSLTKEEEEKISILSREVLIEKLDQIFNAQKLTESKNEVALLKLNYIQKTKDLKKEALDAFVEAGGNKIDFVYAPDTSEQKFQILNQKIKDFHQKKKEEIERLLAGNLEKKKAVLESLKKLIEADLPLKQIHDEFHSLQEEWKNIGQIDRSEVNNLWQSYHFLVEKFFDKVRINNELRDLDYKKNLEQKIQLCEKVEELRFEENLNKSFKSLQQYHEQWKETGPVGLDKKDEIWERFKIATEAINQKRKEYYDSMRVQMEQALLAKTAICEKMEALLTEMPQAVNQWLKLTDETDELLKLWKTLGRISQKENEEIWERFKTSLHNFYETKREFFNKIKDEQTNNYNLKLDLCAQAEEISEHRTDWRTATDELLKLQKQWKETGAVQKKYADKIWKRFRSACDKFFDKKAAQHKDVKEQEHVNMQAKEALIAQLKEWNPSEDKTADIQFTREIQRKWTEIGHVPMKEKDRLYMEFRTQIDAQYAKIGIKSKDQRGIIGRVSGIETAEDAAFLNQKDIIQLRDKINQMREEILLWENNIGFLSRSKSSDLLRNEFERKIQKAKQDLALLEAKFKIIRSTK